MINYRTFKYNDFEISDYTSIDYTEIREYLASLPSDWLFVEKISEGSKIEKVCKDIYGSVRYTNLILFVNNIEAIFGLPVPYDIIDDQISKNLEIYYYRFTGNPKFTESYSYMKMKNSMEKELTESNLKSRYLTLIIPSKISAVQARIDQIIETQEQMYSLLDLEHDQ